MKQHAEITYEEIEENQDYEQIINKVINECFKNEGMDKLKLYVSITLTVPDVIQELNKKYRNIDKATDVGAGAVVLSFPMFEKNEIKKLIEGNYEIEDVLGDLVISIPKVKEQAIEYGHSFERELAYMVVHGFFHLMGYDHIIESDKIIMREKEDEILNRLNITRD